MRGHTHNPAASAEQYGLALAVATGKARHGDMPKDVAREMIRQTPPGTRSRFARELAAKRSGTRLEYTNPTSTIRGKVMYGPAAELHQLKQSSQELADREVTTVVLADYNGDVMAVVKPNPHHGACSNPSHLYNYKVDIYGTKSILPALKKLAQADANRLDAPVRIIHEKTGHVLATLWPKLPKEKAGHVRPGDTGTASWWSQNPVPLSEMVKHTGTMQEGGVSVFKKTKALILKAQKRYGGEIIEATDSKGHKQGYVLVVKKGRDATRNPDLDAEPRTDEEQQAADLYHTFHGTDPEVITEIQEETVSHDAYSHVGNLVELCVASLTGKDVTVKFEYGDGEEPIRLASSPDGKQLYFLAGDQTLDLDKFGMSGDKWFRDHMVLGVLYELTYETQKKFDKFKLIDYYHGLGEESGDMPMLNYDTLNHRFTVVGGAYQLKAAGIIN